MNTCCPSTSVQTSDGERIIVDSVITFPQCSTAKTERMPVDAQPGASEAKRPIGRRAAARHRSIMRPPRRRRKSATGSSTTDRKICSTDSYVRRHNLSLALNFYVRVSRRQPSDASPLFMLFNDGKGVGCNDTIATCALGLVKRDIRPS